MACAALLDCLGFFFTLIVKLILDVLVLAFSPFFYLIYVFQQSRGGCNVCSRKEYRSILVTGASSGIGREFALQMAKQNVTLFLIGRNRSKLTSVKDACEQKNCEVHTFVVDVTNATQLSNVILECDNLCAIDLIFANAGIGFPSTKSHDFVGRFYEMFECNVIGTINTIFPILPRFLQRKSGHIVINSSLASYINKPQISSYSMTKVFLRFFAEMLRMGLKNQNINVTIVNPGYVKTPLLEGYKQNKKTKKLYENAMTVDKAVSKYIIDGIKRNKFTIDFPNILFTLVLWISGLHPIIRAVIASLLINKDESDKEFHIMSIKQSIANHLKNDMAGDSNSNSGIAPYLASTDEKFKFSITQPGAISTLGGKHNDFILNNMNSNDNDNNDDIGIELGQNMGLEQEKQQFLKENELRQKQNEKKLSEKINKKNINNNNNGNEKKQSSIQRQKSKSQADASIVEISEMHFSSENNAQNGNDPENAKLLV